MLNDSGMVALKERRRCEHNEVMVFYWKGKHKIYVQVVVLQVAA
jgi:hypothetical protein